MPSHQPPTALYDPSCERDACGFGLIAQLDDRPTHALIERALEALARMSHRGGIAADGESGDGCGLLIRSPEPWLRALANEAGVALAARFAAGLVFLPHDDDACARVRTILAQALEGAGVQIAGWRAVPIDADACGPLARRSLPRIEQVFVDAPVDMDPVAFERALFLGRRRAEQRLRELSRSEPSAGSLQDAYVVSLSAHSIGYKGMVLPVKLARFYPDLQRSDLTSSAVVFHQRFSTNTQPRWPLAQPFRRLAHNGEINTIAGNRAWAQARAHAWRTPSLDLREFDPVVRVADAPGGRAVVGLDHPARGGRAARHVDRRAAAEQRPGRGRHAARRGLELGQMLVVGQPAHDRRRAHIGQPQPVAEQGQQHFRMEEAAAVEQREDEIGLGLVEQRRVVVGDDERQAEAFENLANLAVIKRVIAVVGVETAGPARMFGDEQQPLVAEGVG